MRKIKFALAFLAALLPAPAFAQVLQSFPNYINSLSAAAALNGSELFYALQNGLSRSATTTQVSTFVLGQYPAYVNNLPAAAPLTGTEVMWAYQGAGAVRTTTGAIAAGSPLTNTGTAGDIVVVGPGASQAQDASHLGLGTNAILPRGLTAHPGTDAITAFVFQNAAQSKTIFQIDTVANVVSLPQLSAGTAVGAVCYNSSFQLITGTCGGGGTITAGTTPTSGFTSGDLIGTSGGVAVDANFLIANIGTVKNIQSGCGNFVNPGGGISVSGTIATSLPVDSSGGNTAYPIPLSDCGSVVDAVITAPQTYTLPSTATATWFTNVANNPGSTATLTVSCGSGCSINGGGTTVTLTAGQNLLFANIGGSPANYRAVGNVGASAILSSNNTWTGTNTYNAAVTFTSTVSITGALTVGQVMGSGRSTGLTTDTLAQTDCGKEVDYTSNAPVTVTIPATITGRCQIAIMQQGTAKVSVNGSAVSPATLQSADGYTGTAGLQWSVIGLDIYTTGVAVLTGRGS